MRRDNREIVEEAEAGEKSKLDFNVKSETRGPAFFFYQNSVSPIPMTTAKDRGDQIYPPVAFRYQEFIFHGASFNPASSKSPPA